MSEKQNEPDYELSAKSRRSSFLDNHDKADLGGTAYPWEHSKHEDDRQILVSMRMSTKYKAKMDYLYDNMQFRSRNQFMADIVCQAIDEKINALLVEEKKKSRRKRG